MITADMSASGRERISSGNSRLTVVSPFAGPTMLTAARGETKEIGTAIAHEDAGWIEVVTEKAKTAAGEGRRQETGRHLMQGKTHRDQTNGGDAGDTGG